MFELTKGFRFEAAHTLPGRARGAQATPRHPRPSDPAAVVGRGAQSAVEARPSLGANLPLQR